MKKAKEAQVILNTQAHVELQGTYQFNIEFYIYPSEGVYIAYCPALDLTTSDRTFNSAIAAFYEIFQLYVEGGIEDGTLHEDLIARGWKVKKRTLTMETNKTIPPNNDKRLA
ncbi:MAG: hypothetical protein LUC22_02235 [Prevotella sp.]|nr:hypothetical protein [Prevotella sp.]